MSFAHLRQSDRILLEQMLSDERQRDVALASLIAYLSVWASDRWIDEEKIYFLGRDIDLVCPFHFRQTIIDAVREKVSGPVADIFLAGFERPAAEQEQAKVVKSLPAASQLDRLTSRLKENANPRMEGDIESLFQRYVEFTEDCGDPEPVVNALIQICTILVSVRGPIRTWAADLARRLAQEGLKWASESDRRDWLWALWGRSLAKMGAFEAAELVYWDSLRQFPWNAYIRSQLIQVLKRQPDRSDEALGLARESFRMFPDNGHIAVQLAKLLGLSADIDNVVKAVDILSSRMQKTSKVMHEASALASILATAEGNGFLRNRELAIVVHRLREKPQILGAIGNYLIKHLKAFTVAQRLWRSRVTDVPRDAIARSQLARAYAASGDKRDLAMAVEILRSARIEFPDHLNIRNHLAKLLASTGAKEDHDEAISTLHDTMNIDDHDLYARNQLAELLAASRDRREREEAISILQETIKMDPRNIKSGALITYARDLLTLVLRTPEGVPIPAQAKTEEPIEIDEDRELDLVESLSIETAQVVPADVAKWGATRRLRFNMDNGSEAEKRAALEQVNEVLHNDPTFAYAKLLAVRQGIWSERTDEMTDFAFAFERALRDHDRSTLDMLSERFPRHVALTIVARAMFGDELSAAKIANLLSGDDEALHPAVRALKRRMRPHLELIKRGQSPESVVAEHASEILVALYDANESALAA